MLKKISSELFVKLGVGTTWRSQFFQQHKYFSKMTSDDNQHDTQENDTRNENIFDTEGEIWEFDSSQTSETKSYSGEKLLSFNTDEVFDYEDIMKADDLKSLTTPVVAEEPLDIKRGLRGVFDVPDIVEVLKKEKVSDITVIKIPEELNYAEHFVIGTAASETHANKVGFKVNKIYKAIKNDKDRFLAFKGSKYGWTALDMGNIVLHVMIKKTRKYYDLESLWTVGHEWDDECRRAQEMSTGDVESSDSRYTL